MVQATTSELESLAEIMDLLTLSRGQVSPAVQQSDTASVLALTDVASVVLEGERKQPRALELSTDEDGWPLAFGSYLKGDCALTASFEASLSGAGPSAKPADVAVDHKLGRSASAPALLQGASAFASFAPIVPDVQSDAQSDVAKAALEEAFACAPAPAKKTGAAKAAKSKAKAKAGKGKSSKGKSSKGNPSKKEHAKGLAKKKKKKQKEDEQEEHTPAKKKGSGPDKDTPAKTGKAELKQDLKNVHSRAYHRALLVHKNAGLEHEPAKLLARKAAAQAVSEATAAAAAEPSDLD